MSFRETNQANDYPPKLLEILRLLLATHCVVEAAAHKADSPYKKKKNRKVSIKYERARLNPIFSPPAIYRIYHGNKIQVKPSENGFW